uniref:Uncharacterized protein n=1 Tax=Rhizophora mucronata TaxID=61149 RepID=A0A2P2NEH7_RHIMU
MDFIVYFVTQLMFCILWFCCFRFWVDLSERWVLLNYVINQANHFLM